MKGFQQNFTTDIQTKVFMRGSGTSYFASENRIIIADTFEQIHLLCYVVLANNYIQHIKTFYFFYLRRVSKNVRLRQKIQKKHAYIIIWIRVLKSFSFRCSSTSCSKDPRHTSLLNMV